MKKIILKGYKLLKNNVEKAKGLMFLDSVEDRLVFVFSKSVNYSFHSFFCPEFDIVFLDKKWRVKEHHEVKTWRIIKPRTEYNYVLEAEPGFIRKNKIEVGDLVILKN